MRRHLTPSTLFCRLAFSALVLALLALPNVTPAHATNHGDGRPAVKIEDMVVGQGGEAVLYSRVTVHYTGWLAKNGKKFDSSLDRGQPFDFFIGAGGVIKGWDIGVRDMRVGGKRRLTIPPELAYGNRGAGNAIPPKATLLFEIELLAVDPPKHKPVDAGGLMKLHSEGAKIIDLRHTPEREAVGYIKGSKQVVAYMPNGNSNRRFLSHLRNTAKPGEPLVVVARDNKTGHFIANIIARTLGYTNVYVLEGGMAAWIEDGHPVTR